ncbi:MAG TPA: FTR1 family protein [Polyangia bacterium]|nr:FTR1 family protein [Polyangia bacterium]
MWQGFTIALREGIESFLIVALTLAYLKKTGRTRLARAVGAGILASLAVCVAAGYLLQRAANQSLWEGILAGVAALLVGSFLVYMLRAAKTIKSKIERGIDRMAGRSSLGGFTGVFVFTVLMITREGMETTLLLATALFQARNRAVFGGLALGLVGAAAVAVTWKRLGGRVNIGILLKVSAVFLGIFLVQLVLYSIHELSEAGVLPNAQAIHDATEILGPDGQIGHALTYLLALVPTLWLLWAWRRGRAQVVPPPADSQATRAA